MESVVGGTQSEAGAGLSAASAPRPLRTAGVARRAAAQLVDLLLGSLLTCAVSLPLMWIMEDVHDDLGLDEFHARWLIGILIFCVWLASGLVVEVLKMVTRRGATPGKRLFRIRVVTETGGAISAGAALTRHATKFFSAFVLMSGFVVCLFDPERRTLHDRVAGTRVVQD